MKEALQQLNEQLAGNRFLRGLRRRRAASAST